MGEIISTVLFGLTIVALVLSVSSIFMGLTTDKAGAEALKERVEYIFMGVAGLTIAGLLFIAG
jgi:hypothetical protein